MPPTSETPAAVDPSAPSAALQFPDFRRYQIARLLSIVGFQMQSVAVGWQLYARTGRALDLGLVGLRSSSRSRCAFCRAARPPIASTASCC